MTKSKSSSTLQSSQQLLVKDSSISKLIN